MKNNMIKVSNIVPNLKLADLDYNANEIIKNVENNLDSGIIVFPELSLTGYTIGDLVNQQLLLDKVIKKIVEIKKLSKNWIGNLVIFGAPIKLNEQLYNTAICVNEGRIVSIIPKRNLPGYSEFYENRWFSTLENNEKIHLDFEEVIFGDQILTTKDNAIKVGVELCEDLWVSNKPSSDLSNSGANIIVNLSASNEIIGKDEIRRNLVKAQSYSTKTAYLYVSSGANESSTDLVFSGHSMIYELGELKIESNYNFENTVSTILDFDKINNHRRVNNKNNIETNTVNIKRIGGREELQPSDLSEILINEKYYISKYPFIPKENDVLNVLKLQALSIIKKVKSTGIYNLILGVSGGLDSTLALLALYEAKKMCNSINIISYTMPSKGSTSDKTYNNAKKLMSKLSDEVKEISIEEFSKLHLKSIGHSGEYSGENDLTFENSQARIRTLILMNSANMKNGIVVGTGDLSEIALGWSTFNGDHMSMYGINSSIPKTLVKKVCEVYAQNLEDQELKKCILDVVDTPISPELKPNINGEISQKTEESIGKYDINDFILYHFIVNKFTPSKIYSLLLVAFKEFEDKYLKKILKNFFTRFFTQQFKRNTMPDGPKITEVSLSPRGDWRMPSDANFNLWLNEINNL